ncbi:MAG: ABC transporter permease [Chloroflexota bacterium]|nr:ABC transporter permease [Chloroflexota bacterium]
MRAYISRRILHSIVTLIGVSLVVFGILRVLPGDPAKMVLPDAASATQVEQMRRQLGLAEPLYIQYGVFVSSVIRGDFGQSFQFRAPVTSVIAERIWPTVHLATVAFLLTTGLGIPAGIVAAARHRTMVDYGSIFVAALGQSVPNFWLGIMMILLFGVALGWLPTSGYKGPNYLVLPAITLAAYPIALVARLTRSSMLEVLTKEYVRTARSKGLRERAVVIRHALKNAAIPVVTILGLQIGVLLGGAVVTESVFAWPGLGKLAVDSIFQRDFPVIQAILMLSAAVFIVINLFVDLTYTVLDPRIRYS